MVGMSEQFLPFARMRERLAREREESDAALLNALLYFGEFATKLTCLGLLASLPIEREGHRYRLLHRLVRAEGIGEWVQAIDDLLTGPASQYLPEALHPLQNQLIGRPKAGSARTTDAVNRLVEACTVLEPDTATPSTRPQLREWFQRFAWLRNKTRGHGAIPGEVLARLCPPLEEGLDVVTSDLVLFGVPWVYLRRSLSGKYRVVPIGGDPGPFAYLKSVRDTELRDGIYIFLAGPSLVPLMGTDVDLSDFFLANGGFNETRFELLSYITGNHSYEEASPYLRAPLPLPASETQGRPQLEVHGNTLVNLPPGTSGYVQRAELQADLRRRLIDDRHPVMTLVGQGGVGKTSLALEVLRGLADDGCFFAIVWFSARDIDLLEYGPKLVAPHALALEDFADQFVALMLPGERFTKGFKPVDFLASSLAGARPDERILFAFDNFETVRNPAELYLWIDDRIRLPNKVLITTRLRQFKADYPVEVQGMSQSEFSTLVDGVSRRLGIRDMIGDRFERDLFRESDGHPYVAKVLLGEAARRGKTGSIERILATREDILDALFQRTFNGLAPGAQRVFLTLANWRSVVPALAVEAALLRPANERFDVREALATLVQSSLVDLVHSDADAQDFVVVPLAAALFGQRELSVSPLKSSVELDTAFLRAFGASQGSDVARGIGPRVDRLIRHIVEGEQRGVPVDDYVRILEFVAQQYPPARLKLADLLAEKGDTERALQAVRQYLQDRPTDDQAWYRLARMYDVVGDYLGELSAWLELASLPGAPFGALSDAANRFNLIFGKHLLEVDSEEKRAMAERLLRVLDSRSKEGNGDDYSRLGWLALHLRDPEAARDYATRGLTLDPNNVHCHNVLARIEY
jgi:tetratricopeptide (TPR) repeat protein